MPAPPPTRLFMALVVAVGAAGVSRGEETTSEGDQYLQVAAKRLEAAERFSLKIDFAVTVGLPGLSHDRSSRYQLHAERPNKFALRRTGGDMGATIVSDGESQYTYLKESNQYTKRPAPRSLDEFSQSLEGAMLLANGMGGIVMALLADDPFSRLIEGSTEREYRGRVQIEGIDCHHVRIVHDEMDFDVWLAAGPDSTLRRIRPDLTKGMGEEERAAEFSIDIRIELNDWNLKDKFDDDTFAFTPPAGAKEVDEFEASGPGEVMPPIESVPKLVGQPAPEFQLEGYTEDASLDLKDVLGKQVIVLDFWATWCGPCREALPHVSQLAEKFADRDVVFRAINLGEDREAIAAFLEEQELKLPILLDPKGESARKYHVSAIPQTVLIGKDGKVQVVHEGMSADFAEQLERNILALLEGKDLAAKHASDAPQPPAAEKQPQPEPSDEPNEPSPPTDEPAGEDAEDTTE